METQILFRISLPKIPYSKPPQRAPTDLVAITFNDIHWNFFCQNTASLFQEKSLSIASLIHSKPIFIYIKRSSLGSVLQTLYFTISELKKLWGCFPQPIIALDTPPKTNKQKLSKIEGVMKRAACHRPRKQLSDWQSTLTVNQTAVFWVDVEFWNKFFYCSSEFWLFRVILT